MSGCGSLEQKNAHYGTKQYVGFVVNLMASIVEKFALIVEWQRM